ncbi:MAG: hypothetical protein MI866_17375 [Bacteroidales bacterium]|nr:hypothetical protein [Bacteroidales bacterium]
MLYQLKINPVSCGKYCSASSVNRTDYDVDNERAIERLLVNKEPLSLSATEYIKQYFCIYSEPKCQSLPMADYYDFGIAKIVSKKLKEIFELACVEGEYVPIKTLDDLNNEFGEFYLAHFHAIIDCLDYEKSQFRWVERKSGRRPTSLKLLEINQSKITDNPPLFRVKYFENKVIVNEDMMAAIKNSDICGILFVPLPVNEFDSAKLIRQLEIDCAQKEK